MTERIPVNDNTIEAMAVMLEKLAALIRNNTPSALAIDEHRHVIEIPSDTAFTQRQDGGLSKFSVTVEFAPGVMT